MLWPYSFVNNLILLKNTSYKDNKNLNLVKLIKFINYYLKFIYFIDIV